MTSNLRQSPMRIFSILLLLLLASLACNLPGVLGDPNTPTPQTSLSEQEAPTESLEAGSPTEAPAATSGQEDPSVDAPATSELSEQSGLILAADAPAVPDCAAFDVNAFNAIVGGTFSFVIQDQLNNCHFESDNGFRLLIGGGEPTSSQDMQTLFEAAFGALPDTTWEDRGGYVLGLAYSSVSVTAQGVSASGHSIVIAVASEPAPDPEAQREIFEALALEAAGQLNAQW